MALWLTQSLTKMSTRNISWGVKGGRSVRLTTLPTSCAGVACGTGHAVAHQLRQDPKYSSVSSVRVYCTVWKYRPFYGNVHCYCSEDYRQFFRCPSPTYFSISTFTYSVRYIVIIAAFSTCVRFGHFCRM
jgi:hypothetical protein